MRTVGAGGVADGIGPTLQDLSSSQAAGPALIIGFASALWSASGYVRAFGRAMNRVYKIGEGRPVWKLRPAMLGLTAVLVVLVAIALLGLVLSGPVGTQSVGGRDWFDRGHDLLGRKVAGDPRCRGARRRPALLRDP